MRIPLLLVLLLVSCADEASPAPAAAAEPRTDDPLAAEVGRFLRAAAQSQLDEDRREGSRALLERMFGPELSVVPGPDGQIILGGIFVVRDRRVVPTTVRGYPVREYWSIAPV